MRTSTSLWLGFAVLFAVAAGGCGGGGGGGGFSSTPGAGTISITAFAPTTIPGGLPTAFTITGTNFVTGTGTLGVPVHFHAISGTPFGGGTEDTADVVGTVVNSTTITGTTPAATVCGVASIAFEVSVTLESGVRSNTFAGGGGGLTFTAPTVASVAPPTVDALSPAAITITGTGFGPIGGTATVRFVGDAGAKLFDDGTANEALAVGTILTSTTISVATPKATICGAASATAGIQVTLDGNGSCSALAAGLLTYVTPTATGFATSGTGGGAGIARQTIANPFTITGTGYAPVGAVVVVRFARTAGATTPFQGGTSDTADVAGDVASTTTVTGVTPLAVATTSFTATVQVIFEDGTCTNAFGPVTFNPPPVVTSVTDAAGPFAQTSVATLQSDRFVGVISRQMNVAGANFVGGAVTTVYKTGLGTAFPIGAGVLAAPIVTTPVLQTGGSPIDATLSGTVPATVRITNPDGQFGEGSTQFVTSAAMSNVNTSFDVGTNSENQIAVNPVNPLNAVALAHQIATAGFSNMNASVTVDGGLTWTKVLIGDTQDGIVQSFRGDPMVAFDQFGNCYMNYISTGGGTDRLMLIQFSGPTVTAATLGALAANVRVLGSSAGSALNQDRNTLAVGGTPGLETVAVGWIDFSGFPPGVGQCAACTSSGVGVLSATVGPVAVASDPPGRFVQNFAPCIGPLGEIYVTWTDSDSLNTANPSNVNFVADYDGVVGGLAFGATVLVGVSDLGWKTYITCQPNRGYGAVPMAVAVNTGAKRGRIVVTYSDEVPAVGATGSPGAPVTNNTVVVTQFSDTLGLSWSPKTYVRPATLDQHWNSWLGLDRANGNVYVTWKETADQPTKNQSVRFASASTDGDSWIAPLRLSQGIATPFPAFSGAAGDYLEYEGTAVFDHRGWAIWADNANFTSTGQVANPHGTTTSDAYVTTFEHKP